MGTGGDPQGLRPIPQSTGGSWARIAGTRREGACASRSPPSAALEPPQSFLACGNDELHVKTHLHSGKPRLTQDNAPDKGRQMCNWPGRARHPHTHPARATSRFLTGDPAPVRETHPQQASLTPGAAVRCLTPPPPGTRLKGEGGARTLREGRAQGIHAG